ncbi:type VI secretion system membrane subunit TssM [Pokkaliibacter plantistimulans]|uniref:Type VI secretion system membrane subunit TssM n=1 Tax=Proteobacteria bacterium 228 TaxID=2083153 RepID=A0A2S5KN40_9PROT|nr:type VI secretion system membrane subunit TssM [Pokkaliibacter plantistimulans]PPC76267.1 type VI secretion system membrane subunit TssM [Pokkaliibacter plantistimulans]
MTFRQAGHMLWNFLTSRLFLSAVGVLCLALLIWFGGPLLAIAGAEPLASVMNRVVLIAAIVFVWVVCSWVSYHYRSKREQEAVNKLVGEKKAQQGEGEDEDAIQDENTRLEIDTLHERISRAMDILKRTQLSKGRSIYQLPWYIMVGPPGSGKTTALHQSGLEFPLKREMGIDALQGVGGTRYCDWWFTNKAVLIDTAGRYTTQDSHSEHDARSWLGFLGLLKKFRPRRPINGVIIAMSMADLISKTRTERNLHARAIKHRIQELKNQLGMNFPVYVLLTKSDLVAGFSEFFAELTPEEREQVWGITFDPQAADNEKGVVGEFNKEFHALLVRLNEMVPERLRVERSMEKRAAIYEFPRQMRLLQAAADDFLKEVFTPNAFEEAPLLRGVYIASATQEGKPIERVHSQLASGLGLQDVPSDNHGYHEGRSFFIRQLLESVVFPEQNLASTNQYHDRQSSWLLRGTLAASVLLLAGGGYVWWNSYQWNLGLIRAAEAAVQDYQSKHEDPKQDISLVLSQLSASLDALVQLPAGVTGAELQREGIRSFGLYQGDQLHGPATAAYQRALQYQFAPHLNRVLVSEMQAVQGQAANLEYLYETLKTYLMLYQPEHRDNGQIQDWYQAYLQRYLNGEQNDGLRASLQAHLDRMLAMDIPIAGIDNAAVDQARKELISMTLAERAYQRLRKELLHSRIPDFRLTDVLGSQSLSIFERADGKPLQEGIPGLYTYNGFHGLFQVESKRILKRLTDDAWVYGDDASELGTLDGDVIAEQVRQKYYRDYSFQWQSLLAEIRLKKFDTITEGARIARVLSGSEQPLQSIIRGVQRNVALTRVNTDNVVNKQVGEVAEKVMETRTNRLTRYLPDSPIDQISMLPGKEVEQQFGNIVGFDEAQMSSLEAELQRLYSYLDNLASADGSDKTAFMSQVDGKGTQELNRTFRDIQRELPLELGTLLGPLNTQSQELAKEGAKTHLNDVWKSKVYGEFRRALQGRYPLAVKADQEVTLKDFGRFFGYGGTLDRYFEEYVAPVVDTSASTWQFEKDIGMSDKSLKMFQDARQIRDAFFEPGSQIPKVDFALKPKTLDEDVISFLLEVDGQSLVYRHGPTRLSNFSWPGDGSKPGVRLVFTEPDSGKTITNDYPGAWGWYRLLDRLASLRKATIKDKQLDINVKGYKASLELVPSSVYNPFWSAELRGFECPATL